MNKNPNKINASDVRTANNFYEDEMFPTSSLAAADCQNWRISRHFDVLIVSYFARTS